MAGGTTRTVRLFSGLHLLLAGFDEESQNQLVDEISERGGQIAERYDSSCTHVIVCNLPANDTVCCAARKDGKALVTDMWITDCLETDTLADVNDVLYRPLKDLGGISGSESLCICLTGYQGLARKKIMRMVEMMGAKFSKPLIGSVVTHLVCYKFEGEKYELAKKMGMFLVNHYWLEDSLDSWTLLLASSYARSGWEAETLRAQDNTVEDSGEEDTVAVQDGSFRTKSCRDTVLPTVHAQSPSEKGGSPIVDDDLKKGLNSHRRLNSRHSLSSSATDTVRKVDSAIDRIADGSDDIMKPVQIGTLPEPAAEDLPVEAADNGNGSSAPDAGEEESTRMYVEDGDENSCGRTSYEDAQDQSDLLLDKMEVCEPEDATDTTCHKMEVMGFATEYTTRQRATGAKDSKSASGDENSGSPGTKRRRRSHIVGNEVEPVLEKSFLMDEEAKDATDLTMEENDTFAGMLNQDPSELDVPGSTANENILAPSVDPGFSDDKLPQEIEECDPKTSFGLGEPAMEISSPVAEHPTRDVRSAQGTPTGSPMKEDGAGTDIQPRNQEKPKKKPSTAGSTKKAKKSSLKNIVSNNTRPVSLKQIARSYNPLLKKKSDQRDPPPVEDKENHIASEDEQAIRKVDQKKRLAIEGKENHGGNEDGQAKQHTASVRTIASTIKPSKRRMASALESSKMCFAVGGSTADRSNLHNIVKMLGGKISKSRYQWRDETTHLVLPGPLRRTEKFLAGAAAGRWILKPEYLEASREAGKFLEEEAYEWFGEGTNDKGSVSLQAPRKWRKWVAHSGARAFQGLSVLFYGECISPPLDTMKRAIKGGGGMVVATAPPYTRHLADGVNFAVISPGVPKEDPIVEEFLKHEIACVLSEYLVDWVCHPSSSLDEHILYGTEKVASQHHEVIAEFGIRRTSLQYNQKCQEAQKTELESDDDVKCSVCGEFNDEAVMLLCGDGKGKGCGEGLHIYCCVPPLQNVPDEDWFCPKCL